MEEIQFSGFLQREETGVVGKGLKKRWCVLKGNSLLFFKDEKEAESKEPLAIIHGEDLMAVITNPSRKNNNKNLKLIFFDVNTKHGTEYLAAEDEKDSVAWVDALKKTISNQSGRQTATKTTFVTIETFLTRGIRVTGQVQPHILAEFSGTGAKKHQDERGWFCDRYVTPSDVLNVMAENGWDLASSFASESTTPGDSKLLPVHSFMFRR